MPTHRQRLLWHCSEAAQSVPLALVVVEAVPTGHSAKALRVCATTNANDTEPSATKIPEKALHGGLRQILHSLSLFRKQPIEGEDFGYFTQIATSPRARTPCSG